MEDRTKEGSELEKDRDSPSQIPPEVFHVKEESRDADRGVENFAAFLSRMTEESEQLRLQYAEETKNARKRAREQKQWFLEEQEKMRKEFEDSRMKLDSWRIKNDDDDFYVRMRQKFAEEKQKMETISKNLREMESFGWKKTSDLNVLRLVEEEKKKTEEEYAKILKLDKRDSKQMLDMFIEDLREKVEGKEQHLRDDSDDALQNKNKELNEELLQKQNEINDLEELNQTLMIKERISNDELQEARKEFIKGLQDSMGNRAQIGIKRMGEIDIKPFQIACKTKFPNEDVRVKVAELYTLWQEKMKQPEWHPFRIITNADGVHQEIINEDDEALKGLKEEYGVEVYEAVVAALKETNEYNPSGRYVVSELWNFKENRKAPMKEVVAYYNKNMKKGKRRKLTF